MNKQEEFDVNNELSKQIKNPEQPEEKKSIKSVLKSVFGVTDADGSGLIDADAAYLRVKYKEYTTRKRLFNNLLISIKQHIKSRVEQNALYTLIEIQPELMDFAEEIAKSLRQYNYQVWVLDKEVLTKLQPDTPVNRTTMFMLIMWDKVYWKQERGYGARKTQRNLMALRLGCD